MSVRPPVNVEEPDWLRHRVRRLQSLRPMVSDERALAAIDGLIAEARERLRQIEGRREH